MKRIFNGIARALAMDMSDVHHIAIYGDLIAAKVQGRTASGSHGTDCALINRTRKKNTKPLSSILSSHLPTAIQFLAVSAEIICIIQCSKVPFSERSNSVWRLQRSFGDFRDCNTKRKYFISFYKYLF